MIKLFDVNNGVVVPTEHCYTLRDLKLIIDTYEENYMDVFLYVFYMTCPNPELNPFFDVKEHEREELILSQIKASFSPEDELILQAIELCKTLYQTPTYRAYMGIKGMLDKLASYMEKTSITDGRDGNITALVNAAKNFEGIRMSFRGAYKDLMEEQKSTVRGGQNLAYDQ
jgi:hypothetical protein